MTWRAPRRRSTGDKPLPVTAIRWERASGVIHHVLGLFRRHPVFGDFVEVPTYPPESVHPRPINCQEIPPAPAAPRNTAGTKSRSLASRTASAIWKSITSGGTGFW